jgi:hypothetical protein
MSHGHLVEESTPACLGGRDVAGTVITFQLPPGLSPEDLPAGPWDLPERPGCDITMHTDEPTRVLATLTGWARHRHVELPGLSVVRPSLEDAYLRLIGHVRKSGSDVA